MSLLGSLVNDVFLERRCGLCSGLQVWKQRYTLTPIRLLQQDPRLSRSALQASLNGLQRRNISTIFTRLISGLKHTLISLLSLPLGALLAKHSKTHARY